MLGVGAVVTAFRAPRPVTVGGDRVRQRVEPLDDLLGLGRHDLLLGVGGAGPARVRTHRTGPTPVDTAK